MTRMLWQTLRWVKRILAIVTGVLLVALMIGGIVFIGAARRAWTLSDLEERGVKIRYWHEYDEKQDPLPPYLRKALGNQWWSEPCEVNFNASDWKHTPTKGDVQLFCSIVGTFSRLREFSIDSEHFTCDLMQDWPTLATLENLQVDSRGLRDSDLEIVASIRTLEYVRIESATITNQGIRSLARLPRLKTLSLDEVEYSASDSLPVDGFPELSRLTISDTPGFTDPVASTWVSPPRLKDLLLRNTMVGDQGLAHLLAAANPEWIEVEGGLVSDASLPELARYNLRWLCLSALPITDDAIAALAGQTNKHLILHHTEITDAALEAIANINGLEYLGLAETKVTGSGLVHLKRLPNLRDLSLDGCALSKEAIKEVAKMKCRDLSLTRTPIDDESLLLFANNDSLWQLNASETKVTAAGVQAFCEARKRHFGSTGKKDDLHLYCDFLNVVRKYYSR